MSEIKESMSVVITRTVSVEFDHDNLPEYESRGKRYRLTSATIPFRWENDEWRTPWSIYGYRRQLLKSGEWGASIGVEVYSHSQDQLVKDLSNEYRPTVRIEIKEN